MRLNNFINELASNYGKGITFIDIDETIFQTKALIYVMKDGQIVGKLSNSDFNTYKLKDGESFDFREFKDADLFAKTSIPIPKVVERIKRMFQHVDIRGSRVVLLTARADFDNRDVFLATFSNVGIPINDIHVERVGNMTSGTVAARKKSTIMKYINTGEYRRVRLIDDDMANLRIFLSIKDNLPEEIVDKVKKRYNITGPETIPPIQFFALQVVDSEGRLKLVESTTLGNVGVNDGPDNGVSDDPIVSFTKDNVKKKRTLDDFTVITSQEDWDTLFSSFWKGPVNVERRTTEQELDEDINIDNIITVLYIMENCHKISWLNEGFMDSFSSIFSNIKNTISGNPLIKSVEVEKGLLSYLKDIGVGGSQMMYHAFNAYYHKNQESKDKIKELAKSVKKEHIIDILMKLDVLTLHLITGPLHIIEAITGWNILSHIKSKIESSDKKAKSAIEAIETLGKDLDDKLRSQMQNYANAIRRVFGISDFQKVSEETVGADVAVPDTLIGGQPGEAPSMTRRLKKKKKKKSLETYINTDKIKGVDN